MYADIITIGDEILIGQITNTNSSYIGEELTKIGISIRRMISIPDLKKDIIETLDDSIKSSDFLIITGGLGPTNDDITKKTLNDYFGGKLVIDTPSLNRITGFFKRRGFRLTDRNRAQAEVPDVCKVLPNQVGTAPGMLFQKDGKLIASVPGVPFEMKGLLNESIIPLLKEKYTLPVKLHTTLLASGLSESYTADKIKAWESALGPEFGLAYLPSIGQLRIRISISGSIEDQLKLSLKEKVEELTILLGNKNVFGIDKESLPIVLGRQLQQKKCTLSIAESCTGGNIAQLIASVPGASNYFKGSVVAYSNEIKRDFLGVSSDSLTKEGAVSKEVVEQMAEGIRERMCTDFSIATSGIAGPDGGTKEKPLGTTWIAVSSPEKTISTKFLFGDNRERNIIRASLTALNMLRNVIDNSQ